MILALQVVENQPLGCSSFSALYPPLILEQRVANGDSRAIEAVQRPCSCNLVLSMKWNELT